MKGERKVPEWKLKEVEEIKGFIKGKKIVGLINLAGLQSTQLQEIRKKLRGKADIRISKSVLVQKAFETSRKPEFKELEKYLGGPCGLIVSDEDPFKLSIFLKKNKSKIAAKPGTIAEKEIIVPAGETDMPPGPALAEFKVAGIDARIEKGKIAIAKDCVVAKPGQKITPQIAAALAKLGIKPMEAGIEILALTEKGVVYPAKALDIDTDKIAEEFRLAHAYALNLSVVSAYTSKASIGHILQKAASNARNFAYNAKIITKENVGQLLALGVAHANALGSKIPA